MKSNRFYLACWRDNVGSNVAFHCKDGKGYSTDIRRAHVYTREEAQMEWNRAREIDIPLCADRVDAVAEVHVDCQYIPSETVIEQGCTEYVAYQDSRWNGNDRFWLTEGGLPSCDFRLAAVFKSPTDAAGVVWMPFHLADAAKRPTIQIDAINKRAMIQAAGLITPEHIKRERRRTNSGKTRFNCPGCGKIHWQYNPYDFDGCRDISCDEWRH